MQSETVARELAGTDKDIVERLAAHPGGMVRAELCAALTPPPTHSSLSRRLSSLVKAGVVTKSGQGKEARYFAFGDRTALPPRMRDPVAFDPRRIEDYVPGESAWLPAAERARMEEAATRLVHEHDVTTYCAKIGERLLVDLCWASAALKGEGIDYMAAESMVKYSQVPADRKVDRRLVLNHKNAFLTMLSGMGRPDADCVRSVHAELTVGMVPHTRPGRLRDETVALASTSYVPPAGELLADQLDALMAKSAKVSDPYEAAFLLLAGISYLQPFWDGSERTARIVCNIPLLAHALPPLSFLGIDRSSYRAGLVTFYETGDTTHLAAAVADAYVADADGYAAVAGGHPPQGEVEARESIRIAEEVWSAVMGLCAPAEAEPVVRTRFEDLPEDERDHVVGVVLGILADIDDSNCVRWGVEPEYAIAYRREMDARG